MLVLYLYFGLLFKKLISFRKQLFIIWILVSEEDWADKLLMDTASITVVFLDEVIDVLFELYNTIIIFRLTNA